MPNDKDKEIAKAKFIVGTPIQDIADDLGVSRRTIERWAKSGNWRDLQQHSPPSNIISFQPKPKNPKPEFRPPVSRGQVDDLEVIESTLSELHASLPEADDKSKGGIAGAIARLVELKRKIKPASVLDLVERAIELGIRPDDLLRELRDAWARKA